MQNLVLYDIVVGLTDELLGLVIDALNILRNYAQTTKHLRKLVKCHFLEKF